MPRRGLPPGWHGWAVKRTNPVWPSTGGFCSLKAVGQKEGRPQWPCLPLNNCHTHRGRDKVSRCLHGHARSHGLMNIREEHPPYSRSVWHRSLGSRLKGTLCTQRACSRGLGTQSLSLSWQRYLKKPAPFTCRRGRGRTSGRRLRGKLRTVGAPEDPGWARAAAFRAAQAQPPGSSRYAAQRATREMATF